MRKIWFVFVAIWLPFIFADNLTPDDDEDYVEWLMKKTPEEFRDYQLEFTKQDMDFSVNPCENFYKYSCGKWAKNHEDYAGSLDMQTKWHTQFIRTKLKAEILPEDSPAEKSAKIFYKSCKNLKAIQNRGSDLVENWIKNVGSFPITDNDWSEENFDWIKMVATASLYNINLFFKMKVLNTEDNPQYVIVVPNQIQIVLDADNVNLYLNDNSDDFKKLTEFVEKLENLINQSRKDATDTIFNNSFLHNVFSTIQKAVDIEEPDYLAEKVILFSKSYFQELEDLINASDTRTVANYIYFKLFEELSQIAKLNFRFFEDFQIHMGPVLSLILTKYRRGEEMRGRVSHIVTRLRRAAQDQLTRNDWLDEKTKAAALEKLNAVEQVVGVGDEAIFNHTNQMYGDLDLKDDKYFENRLIVRKKNRLSEFLSVGKDENAYEFGWKQSWESNAFYNPNRHGYVYINLGILDMPAFHLYSPHYANYGGLGTIVGHEFMHGFDPGTFLRDHKGVKRMWISEWLQFAYLKRSSCYLRQYNKLKVGNTTIDGKKTLDENVADNVGLKIAYDAYMDFLKDHPEEAASDKDTAAKMNLSTDQAFFLSFAQNWCHSLTTSDVIEQMKDDEHSPYENRIIGAIQNSKEFAAAFSCPAGSKMNPYQICTYL